MTNQEIFNIVSKHLLTQNKRCVDYQDGCRYRGDNGLKCAVGCLIPDDIYDENLEHKGIAGLLELHFYKDLTDGQVEFFAELRKNEDLLTALQRIHDTEKEEDWKRILKNLASKYKLTFNELL